MNEKLYAAGNWLPDVVRKADRGEFFAPASTSNLILQHRSASLFVRRFQGSAR
jgi:hypothetical protein